MHKSFLVTKTTSYSQKKDIRRIHENEVSQGFAAKDIAVATGNIYY